MDRSPRWCWSSAFTCWSAAFWRTSRSISSRRGPSGSLAASKRRFSPALGATGAWPGGRAAAIWLPEADLQSVDLLALGAGARSNGRTGHEPELARSRLAFRRRWPGGVGAGGGGGRAGQSGMAWLGGGRARWRILMKDGWVLPPPLHPAVAAA